MRYCSIDIETTGTDPETCQVLEIGIIVEDTMFPKSFEDSKKLNIIIDRNVIHGESYAINMNSRIFRILAEAHDIKDNVERRAYKKLHSIIREDEVAFEIWKFMYVNGFGEEYRLTGHSSSVIPYFELRDIPNYQERIILPKQGHVCVTAAGKNFSGFDKLFLKRIPCFSDFVSFRQRVLDPTLAYTDFAYDDVMPNMAQCFEKFSPGSDSTISHTAILDAWDVICLLRPLYDNFNDRMALMRSARYVTPRMP